jgi:hypothetical protein
MFGGKNKGVWTANMAALGVNVIIAFYRSITRTQQQIDHKLITTVISVLCRKTCTN